MRTATRITVSFLAACAIVAACKERAVPTGNACASNADCKSGYCYGQICQPTPPSCIAGRDPAYGQIRECVNATSNRCDVVTPQSTGKACKCDCQFTSDTCDLVTGLCSRPDAGVGPDASSTVDLFADVIIIDFYSPNLIGYSAGCGFQKAFPPKTGFTVTETSLGAGITRTDYSGDLTAVPPAANSGVITITGSGGSATLTPDVNNLYAGTASFKKPLAMPNESITVAAAGGADVPAWTGTVQQPAPAILDAPVESNPFVLDPTVPFHVAVSGGGASNVVLVLNGAAAATKLTVIKVVVPLTNGAATFDVAPSVLGALPPGPGGSIQLYLSEETKVPSGAYKVGVSARTYLTAKVGGLPVFQADALTVKGP